MAVELDRQIFEAPVKVDLMHAVVVAQAAKRRSGTAATRNRALTSGGGRKPFRQKGTGRARQGTIRAPQHAGGGVVFGPQPRGYAQGIPKKVRKAALCSALALRAREEKVHLVAGFELPEIKTRWVAKWLEELGARDALIVTAVRDRRLERAARNLTRVRVLAVAGLNGRDILAREYLVLVNDAHAAGVERLQ